MNGILGVGCDIIYLPRINAIFNKYGDRFLNKAYHPEEIKIFYKKTNYENRIQYLASRWAVKEAAYKAFGGNYRIPFPNMLVTNTSLGQPILKFEDKAQEYAKLRRVSKVHLSISHDKDYAIANILLEGSI